MLKNMAEIKKRNDAKCRHFTGTINDKCDANIEYPIGDLLPCWGENTCVGYSPLTTDELAAKEAERVRRQDLFSQGLSACCEAPFDYSAVIPSGRYKNHGPRYCSACSKLCYMV
jgi:hypothetical protein